MLNPFIAIKHLKQFIHHPLEFSIEMQKKHGDFFPLYLGHKKFFFAYHPKHAEQMLGHHAHRYKKCRLIFDKIIPITGQRGLVQLEGDAWLKMRKITGETFKHAFFNEYLVIINHYLDQAIKKLDTRPHIDMFSLMMEYTIKTISSIIFGMRCENQSENIAKAFITLNQHCGNKMRSIISLPYWIPSPTNHHIQKTRKFLAREVDALIRSAKNQPYLKETSLLFSLIKKISDPKLIHDQLITFLFAGYETTAASLTFCFYLLSTHPSYQQKIREEASSVDFSTQGVMRQLIFTKAIYQESLRLFPPAWILAREVIEAETIENYKLQPRDNIILCVRQIHRHKDIWTDADQFIPERFLSSSLPHKFAFIPFGMGQRICSGNHLAMLEGTVALAKLCQHYEFSRIKNSTLEAKAMVTLHPKNNLLLTVKKHEKPNR